MEEGGVGGVHPRGVQVRQHRAVAGVSGGGQRGGAGGLAGG